MTRNKKKIEKKKAPEERVRGEERKKPPADEKGIEALSRKASAFLNKNAHARVGRND